ncbi:MAG: hypothetical protein JXA71_05630 [Chitinispirillaceae bacterium]|nr:hypothetical protein [Chitinispirillaceae bacterium]
MVRASPVIEPCEDIQFFHRPLPPEGTDLVLYIEEQIAGLLFNEESLDTIMYRFSVDDDGLLVAVARKSALEKKRPAGGTPSFRIPAPVALWLRARFSLNAEKRGLLHLRSAASAWLLYADAVQIYHVYRLNAPDDSPRELLLAIDRIRGKNAGAFIPQTLLTTEPLSGSLEGELRDRSMTASVIPLPDAVPFDRAVADQWDFRLPTERADQELWRWKRRAVMSGALSAAAILLLWLGLAGGNLLLEKAGERSMKRWAELRASIKEINFLQKETGDLIAEISLCRKLAEKRTNRALALEKIGASRPSEARLQNLRFSERRKKFEKGKAVMVAEGQVLLGGYADDPVVITAWMESLLKSGTFTAVNLLSMERKGDRYFFQIECGLDG